MGLIADLHVGNPSEVVGAAVVRAELGDGRTMVVLSGIARPEFEINDDHVHQESCRVHLGEPGERMVTSSIHVGLASISNDDTEFVFAVDSAALERDLASDELVLTVALAISGERSYLHRFSYQVVLYEQVVATEITGTLTWQAATFSPVPPDPATVTNTLSVVAIEGAGAALGPVFAVGTIMSVNADGGAFHATYRITDVPKDKLLTVVCNVQGLPPEISMVPTDAGAAVLTLTAARPTRSGIDFLQHRSVVA